MSNSRTPDVLVVGAGIIGGSAAWRLAQHGLRVTLVDAGEMGGEASRAGAGMLAPGGEWDEESRWSYLAVESRRLYPAFVEELQAESGERIDLRLCGALDLARGEDEWLSLTTRAARQNVFNIQSEQLSREEALALAPALSPGSFDQAMFYPNDGIIDPTEVTRALKAALVRLGVTILEHTAVTRIDLRGQVAEAGGQRLDPGAIVIAAGAWSGSLADDILPESTPIKGHLLGYSLPPASLTPVVRHGHTYMLQRSNGFLIAGSTTEEVGFDRRVDPAIVASLHEDARRYLPDLLEPGPSTAWVGFRPGVRDSSGRISHEPMVERLVLADGTETVTWLAYGHYRNGILLAPVTAKLLAGQIVLDPAANASLQMG